MVVSASQGGTPVGDDRNRLLDEAAALDTTHIVCPSGGQEAFVDRNALQRLADRFSEAIANCAARGYTFGYHNHAYELLSLIDGEPALLTLHNLLPELYFTLDTYWVKVGQQDPVDIQVVAHKAANGVEDDVAMLFDYGDSADGVVAMLATSFRSKLQNWAYVIGEEGYIAIPDFWRAHECSLYHLDTRIDHFDDGRKSLGFNYETVAVNEDILAGRQQNDIMPWSNTIRFQEDMERVKERF